MLRDPRRVKILDRKGKPRWHPIWQGNPRIAAPGEEGDYQEIVNGGGARPYIDAAGSSVRHWQWRAYDCAHGEIYLSETETAFAAAHRPQVVIEPNTKQGASPNKQWGLPRWQQFAWLAIKAGFALAQMGPPGVRPLRGVQMIVTTDFRLAAAVLARARAFVGPDGGMHHAAAALGIPAVVVRGAFVSQAVTGYLSQRNLFTGEGLGCGMRVPCPCCARAMSQIEPERVLNELKGLLA